MLSLKKVGTETAVWDKPDFSSMCKKQISFPCMGWISTTVPNSENISLNWSKSASYPIPKKHYKFVSKKIRYINLVLIALKFYIYLKHVV